MSLSPGESAANQPLSLNRNATARHLALGWGTLEHMQLSLDQLSQARERMSSARLDAVMDVGVKKVLVPLDFSDSARRALGCAITLATQFHAEVVLLHVFEPVPPELKILEGVFADPSFREQAAKQLAQWHALVPPQLKARAAFREGKAAYREIIKAAVQEEVDLIVLGRHGRKGLDRVVMGMGSTAGRVFKQAPCAVLVIAPENNLTIADS